MRKIWLVFVSCLVICELFLGGLSGVAGAAAPNRELWYTMTELGVPEGYSNYYLELHGMNNRGDVVGTAPGPDNKVRAILWEQTKDVGALLPLLPGYEESWAYGINDAGQISGYCRHTGSGYYQNRACTWDKGGGVAALPVHPYGGHTVARGINQAGKIAGWGSYHLYGDIGLIWENGQVTEIGHFSKGPGQYETHPYVINSLGQVAGQYYQTDANGLNCAFWWTPGGGFFDLNPADGRSWVYGSNSLGHVVGVVNLPGEGVDRPCRWVNGTFSLLSETLSWIMPTGFNDLGQVVFNNGLLWEAGQITDVNELLPPGSPRVIPVLINNGMQIAAKVYVPGSSSASYKPLRLDPVTKKYRFRIIDLGEDVYPRGLNRGGEVVGDVYGRAFLWQGGKMQWTSLTRSGAQAINGTGTAVGWATVGDLDLPVLWSRQGLMTLLGTPGEQGVAYAVNSSGVAAGFGRDTQALWRPCLWQAGARQFLAPGDGIANGINDSKYVAGEIGGIPFRWTPGDGLQMLSDNPGVARAVNNLGEIAGKVVNAPCLWDPQKQVKFLAKDLTGEAFGINYNGQVVGTCNIRGETCAFLWDEEYGLEDLNKLLLPRQPDWELTKAISINMGMQIIGEGKYKGKKHGFLLERVGNSVSEIIFPLLLQK